MEGKQDLGFSFNFERQSKFKSGQWFKNHPFPHMILIYYYRLNRYIVEIPAGNQWMYVSFDKERGWQLSSKKFTSAVTLYMYENLPSNFLSIIFGSMNNKSRLRFRNRRKVSRCSLYYLSITYPQWIENANYLWSMTISTQMHCQLILSLYTFIRIFKALSFDLKMPQLNGPNSL